MYVCSIIDSRVIPLVSADDVNKNTYIKFCKYMDIYVHKINVLNPDGVKEGVKVKVVKRCLQVLSLPLPLHCLIEPTWGISRIYKINLC